MWTVQAELTCEIPKSLVCIIREVARNFSLSFPTVREWRRHLRLKNKNKLPRLSTVSHYLSKQSKELHYNSFYMSNLSH